MDDYDLHYKHIIIGDASCGKSSYLKMLVKEEFNSKGRSTIGVDFETYYNEYDNKRIKNHIWDTAGQEKFRSIVKLYFKGASSFIIMYDITNYNSFKNIENWLLELNQNENYTKILIGNKSDLEELRVVTKEEAKLLALKYNMNFMEISVKQNQRVKESFEKLISNISEDFEKKKNFNLELEQQNFEPNGCFNCIIL